MSPFIIYLPKDYHAQVTNMKENDTTTMYIDMNHLDQHDDDLADAIASDYYRYLLNSSWVVVERSQTWSLASFRLEPHLRKAVQNFVREKDPDYALAEDRDKEFFVSFYNLPYVEKWVFCVYQMPANVCDWLPKN